MNDSSTGGYLVPASTELNDDALADLLQEWFAGVSALDITLVRPDWQEDPPSQPANNVTWMSIGITSRDRDWQSYRRHIPGNSPVPGPATPGTTLQYRNELLRLHCICYGPNSEAACAAVWNNSQIGQNREPLTLAGIAVVSVDQPHSIPEQIKQKWVRRYDFEVLLRRAVCLIYPIRDLDQATVVVTLDDPPLQVIEVTPSVLATQEAS